LVVLAFGIIWNLWRTTVGRNAHQKRRKICSDYCRLRVADGETIFVSVPSYRDPMAAKTVVDLFEKARCPRRVFVGVCSQIDAERDSGFMESYAGLAKRRRRDGALPENVRLLEISHQEARGPMLARSLIETQLYRGETFYLMVDSHTSFAVDWDVHCVRMLRECPSGRNSVLSTYPPDYSNAPSESEVASKTSPPTEEEEPLPDKPSATYLRFKCFNQTSSMPEIEGPSYVGRPARPHPSAFWGACFSFGYAETQIGKVPYDPHAHFVFLGEETSYAARLFTHGVDVYSPPATVVFHRWDRGYRSTFWELLDANKHPNRAPERRRHENVGNDRIKLVLGMLALPQCSDPRESSFELEKYGLGRERTLRQYEEFAGLSLVDRKAGVRARMGISPEASSEEILSKYGTMARYRADAQRLGYSA
jgi:[Skp1-protein]-hydroxyproline N-acetylglucosaminyltransferase